MKKKRKIAVVALALILGMMFVLSGIRIYEILKERQTAQTVYGDLGRFVQYPRSRAEDENLGPDQDVFGKDQDIPGNGGSVPEELFPKIDFHGLWEVNAQTVGWIYCEGTSISFPVVQGEDNEYYLKHMFNGEENPDGSIFLDSGNKSDFSDCHNIIYGHHMNSGAMFAPLLEYKKQEFYEEHPRMLLMTPEGNYVVEIFAGYVADVEADAWRIEFSSLQEYGEWIERSVSKSWISAGAAPAVSDRVLTLSTCSYEFENARFVLLGVMRPGAAE